MASLASASAPCGDPSCCPASSPHASRDAEPHLLGSGASHVGGPTTKLAIPARSSSSSSDITASTQHVAAGRTLSELFDSASAKCHALDTGALSSSPSSAPSTQDTVKACIAELEACATIIRANAVFSPNETLRDLSTRRLSYLLVPLRLAELQDKVRVDLSNGPGPRLSLLERADGYLGEFLQRCIAHQLPDDVDAERYASFLEGDVAGVAGGDDSTSGGGRSRGSPEVKRERKLQSYQRHRAAQTRIAEILEIRARRKRKRNKRRGGSSATAAAGNSGGGDAGEDDADDSADEDSDGLERERVLLVLRSGVRDALDMLVSHQRELPMLRHMMKMMGGDARAGAAGGQRTDPRVKAKREKEREAQRIRDYQNRPGLSLTHIGPDGSVRKEQLKAQVFRPGWRQPTMSLEELAEIEVRDAMARKERQVAAEASDDRPGMKMKQLEEAGKEDDLELVDKATQRDRQWDNWKDMNPRGYGVTKKI